MRVKLRPGTHFAPVQRGVYVTRGGESFVLAGPPVLYTVLDSRLAELTDGTDVDALVAAFGDESARPVLDRVLRALLDRDVLLDLDALTTPAPDPATAARHAETLAYLEAHSPDPYRDFARLRAAKVHVLGGGPAAGTAARSLRRHGVTDTSVSASLSADGSGGSEAVAAADWTVLVTDHEHPSDPPAALPPGTRVVTVHAGPRAAVVAEPDATTDPAALEAAVRRAEAWTTDDPEAAAPRPLSAVLAGALAARAVLAALTGIDPAPRKATVIHGHQLRTARIPLPEALVVAGGGADVASAGAGLPAASAGAAGDGRSGPAGVPAEERELPGAQDLLAAWAPLTARWTGPVRLGRDLDLDQLPFALETADLLTGPTPVRVVGWGADRAAAGVAALLAAARRMAGPDGAAGATEERWLLDGALRQLGTELLLDRPGEPLGWDGLGSTEGRTLLGLLESWFGRTVELSHRRCPVLDWSLVTVTEQDGTVAAAEWGDTPAAAARTALATAVARAQADPEVRALFAEQPVGTGTLENCPAAAVRSALDRLRTDPATRGRTLRARRLPHDPVAGPIPLHCGPVKLA
ncbi:hypothetical protein [Kitasatospora phosalacinea]|uniref:Uncharacterized protein n=1 Tax=Kitasatospora phosalacinea TaxID=2065 RepID=A0A9W6PK67_9ACTN|nr:hypothetical protein [Kitasatospora phosalacinea]GLW56356.1 hypothetical protein Kpho01_43670 [Kitasatospora phosalacinea]